MPWNQTPIDLPRNYVLANICEKFKTRKDTSNQENFLESFPVASAPPLEEQDFVGSNFPVSPSLSPVQPNLDTRRTRHDEVLIEYQGQPVHFLPFKVAAPEISHIFNSWKHSMWFAPQGFATHSLLIRVESVLIPHWLFDVDCQTRIDAVKEQVNPQGSISAPITDFKRAYYNNVICVAAQNSLSYYELLLELVQTWNNQALLLVEEPSNFFGNFVTSVRRFVGTDTSRAPRSLPPPGVALLPAIEWRKAFETHCRASIEQMELREASMHLAKRFPNVPISQVKVNLEVREHFVQTLIYLPVWVCTYHYEGRQFHVLINGQNGKPVGQRPPGMLASLMQYGTGMLQYLESFFWTKPKH